MMVFDSQKRVLVFIWCRWLEMMSVNRSDYGTTQVYAYRYGNVALGDIDNDGLPDIVTLADVVAGGPPPPPEDTAPPDTGEPPPAPSQPAPNEECNEEEEEEIPEPSDNPILPPPPPTTTCGWFAECVPIRHAGG